MTQALNTFCFELGEMFDTRIRDKVYHFSMYNSTEYRLKDYISFVRDLIIEDLEGTCVGMDRQTFSQAEFEVTNKPTEDSKWHAVCVFNGYIESIYFYLK